MFEVYQQFAQQNPTYLKAGVTFVAVFVLALLSWFLVRRLQKFILSLRGTRIKSLQIQSFPLLTAEVVARLLVGTLKFLFWVWLFLLAYIALTAAFLISPATEHFAVALQAYLKVFLLGISSAILAYTPNLLTIIVALVVCRYVLGIIGKVLNAIGHKKLVIPGFDPDWAPATKQLLRFLVVALTLVIVAPLLPGAASPAFKGISVFLGVLVSLGSGGAITNIVSGVFLTYTNAFKIGDIVQFSEYEGRLVERTLLVTRIRTFKNEDITVPNSKVMEASIKNYSNAARRGELVIHSTITLGYDAPWKKVHELLLECAERTDGLLDSPPPFVLQTSLDGAWVAYQINAVTDQAERMPRIYSDLRAHIQDVFNEAGIELMTTEFYSHRDGNLSTIPESYGHLDESVGFRVLKAAP